MRGWLLQEFILVKSTSGMPGFCMLQCNQHYAEINTSIPVPMHREIHCNLLAWSGRQGPARASQISWDLDVSDLFGPVVSRGLVVKVTRDSFSKPFSMESSIRGQDLELQSSFGSEGKCAHQEQQEQLGVALGHLLTGRWRSEDSSQDCKSQGHSSQGEECRHGQLS